MPYHFMARLLARSTRQEEADDLRVIDRAALTAVRLAREKRQENAVRLRLTETRNRLNGWSH